MVIRLATKNDIEIIVKLRLKMLQDYEENLPQELSGAIQNYLEKHINDNSCICSLNAAHHELPPMASRNTLYVSSTRRGCSATSSCERSCQNEYLAFAVSVYRGKWILMTE